MKLYCRKYVRGLACFHSAHAHARVRELGHFPVINPTSGSGSLMTQLYLEEIEVPR